MRHRVRSVLAAVWITVGIGLPLAGCLVPLTPAPPPPMVRPTSAVSPEPVSQHTPPAVEPHSLVSQESLFAYLEDLTAIQPYSGWRSSATQGEAEALDYVSERLGKFDSLRSNGMTLSRQEFRVFLSTELWDARLYVTVDGEEVEVPASGLRGLRDDIVQTLRFDSDGVLNDSESNPASASGPGLVVRLAQDVEVLDGSEVEGRIVFLDYAAVDRVTRDWEDALKTASDLIDKGPAGLVLVTQFSNEPGESHGAFVGDVSVLSQVKTDHTPPILYVRLEDMASADIAGWEDLASIGSARVVLDADVFSPGTSGNLVARVPGADPSRAVILGAHIDSPNSPGAMDDGSGSVVLLEVARVLNAAARQPPVDLYLVWFGSEEVGLYGSYHFASTHQDLLDRTLAMLQIDCLTRPLEGIDASLNLVAWSYGRLGDDRLTWPDYLAQLMASRSVDVFPANYYGVESDSTAFTGFGVPSANLIYLNMPQMEEVGGVHYAGHLHDPYDTVELAQEVDDVLTEMAHVALSAALSTGRDDPVLRLAPAPRHRALFVASHTESVHMSPTTFTDLGMALAWEGFDVDLVPYGQSLQRGDLEDTDLVVVLPVLDYPDPESDVTAYDEAWSQPEIATLEDYVANGGLLVLTSSAHRLKYHNVTLGANEDWADVNDLSRQFGIAYDHRISAGERATTEGDSLLTEGIEHVDLIAGNAISLRLETGEVLAQMNGDVVVGLVGYGPGGGEVLALGDVGILGASDEPHNLAFWVNLARYARSR